jgi:hypothetical protein
MDRIEKVKPFSEINNEPDHKEAACFKVDNMWFVNTVVVHIEAVLREILVLMRPSRPNPSLQQACYFLRPPPAAELKHWQPQTGYT